METYYAWNLEDVYPEDSADLDLDTFYLFMRWAGVPAEEAATIAMEG